jgi:hypothetical protein
MKVSEGRVKVTFACSEQGFALRATQDGDKVRFVAIVAEDFSDSAGVCVPSHVGCTSAVVGDFAGRFASDSKSIGEVARGAGSAESVAVELALLRVGGRRG